RCMKSTAASTSSSTRRSHPTLPVAVRRRAESSPASAPTSPSPCHSHSSSSSNSTQVGETKRAALVARPFYLVSSLVASQPRGLFLMDRPPAVDHQHVADDHVRQVAREEQDGADQVARLVPASDRQHLLGGPFAVAGPLEDVLA